MNTCIWIVAAILGLAPTPSPRTENVPPVVRKVQARYDTTVDFTASVDQEIRVASADRTLHATGTVAFKKPGKMRWILRNHEKQVIIADGKTLWFYQPDDNQVLKAPFATAFRSSAPISFLTGVGRITEDFDITPGERKGGTVELLLRPRHKDEDLGRLSITVDLSTFDIIGAQVIDILGNVTRIRFTNIKRNVGLDDDIFHFDVPPGVDVIEAPVGF